MNEKLIYLFSRVLKLVANVLKLLCYVFHYFFPKKRFVIPHSSAALIRSSKASKIPRILWQTNYTNRVTLPVYLNYLCNRLMAPNFEYRYMGHEERADFLKASCSEEIYNTYAKLTVGAAQADLWRLLVLNTHGGVYMDIDAHLVWPLSCIVKPDYEELYLTNKGGYTNYFIASKPANPLLEKMVALILDNIKKRLDTSVYGLTGPVVTNAILEGLDVPKRSYKITCIQGDFTNEYFQYVDHPTGKWNYVKNKDIIKEDS